MYGRGNYAPPQFGQSGLQRPMPPYQQPSAGGLPPPMRFQQGQPFPMQPVIQQGGLPHGVPPRGPGYSHAPPAPMNMPPQGPSNASQSFLQRPLIHGGPPAQHPYQGGQQNFQSQNPHHAAPLPPPPSIGPPRALAPPLRPGGYGPAGPHSTPNTQQGIPYMSLPPPPPPQGASGFFLPPAIQQQSSGSHIPLPPQPPPPPPASLSMVPHPPLLAGGELSSTPGHGSGGSPIKHGDVPDQNQYSEPESTDDAKTESGGEGILVSHADLSLKQIVPLELPPPPSKPADEKVLQKIEVLCRFIAKYGSQFEEKTRKNESGNPEFSFLVGGDPGSEASCAHEYFLWMKKKLGLQNDLDNAQEKKNLLQGNADGEASEGLNSLANVAMVHSPADSDVDMEDDITQTDKEPELSSSGEDLKSEPVSTTEVLGTQKQETTLAYAKDSSSVPNSKPSVKSVEGDEIKPEDSSVQPAKTDSPFRLIPNYAPDDDSEDEPPHEPGETQSVNSPPNTGISTLCDDKSGSASEPGQSTSSVDNLLMKQESLAVQSESQGTMTRDSSPGKHELFDKYVRAEPSNPNTKFGGRYATGFSGVDPAGSKDIERKDKSTTTAMKVDEFGRLAKEDASDSESDDTPPLRRHGRRDRSRSRSRSPSDRRRRRSPLRNPRRRKGRRSRSRSWSPRRRRSRSRSPNRSSGDFGAEKLRRGKMETQECFDFLKGQCYRGSLCRYLHLDVRKNESSRRYKGNQYQSDEGSTRNSEFGDRVPSGVPLEQDDKKGEKIPSHPDKFDGDGLTSKMTVEDCKTEPTVDDVPSVLNEDVENSITDVKRSEGHPLIGGEHPTIAMPSTIRTIHHSSVESRQRGDGELPLMVSSSKTDSSAVETSVVSTSGTSATESYHGLGSSEPTGPSASVSNLPGQVPRSPLLPQSINAPQQSNGPVEYNSISSVSIPLQTVPPPVVPPYKHHSPSQQSHHPDPPISTWSNLPPPQVHPPHWIESSVSGAPLQFQHGSVPLRTDFPSQMSLRAQSGELAGRSQAGGFQYQKYALPASNVPGVPFAGPSSVRDDRLSQFPSHGHGSIGSFTPEVPPQPGGLFPGNSNVMQSFAGSSLLGGDSSKQAFHNHQHSQERPPTLAPSLTAADSLPSHFGGPQPVPGYASDPLAREQPSQSLDVSRSRISAHYNPYASTFDQPMSSRFSSNAFAREREAASGMKYDSSFGLSHGPIEGQTASSYGSRQIIPSPNSSRAGGRMPRLGGDQYDPLFDSIEPSSKLAQKQDHAADNSDMLKLSNHQKVLDVAENNKQKDVGAVVATASLENDEYGETADAEVGAVENGSFSDSDEDAIAEGAIEIDQVQPGGDKKSKDSRSMKLFKGAVANFVKDVLKPQWRQGNMSKEVFKTIVKKTVDKVSGAMKNHRLPKSQAKIDHYIDSSRRKLTQLVEGYVSKYKS